MDDMTGETQGGIAPGRLDTRTLAANFADAHPPLSPAEAVVEASRCYFCYDAPCIEACPTGIDIPVVHPQDRLRQHARLGDDDLGSQHLRRFLRPRLPDRGAVPGGLRPHGAGGQAGADRRCCSAMPPTG